MSAKGTNAAHAGSAGEESARAGADGAGVRMQANTSAHAAGPSRTTAAAVLDRATVLDRETAAADNTRVHADVSAHSAGASLAETTAALAAAKAAIDESISRLVADISHSQSMLARATTPQVATQKAAPSQAAAPQVATPNTARRTPAEWDRLMQGLDMLRSMVQHMHAVKRSEDSSAQVHAAESSPNVSTIEHAAAPTPGEVGDELEPGSDVADRAPRDRPRARSHQKALGVGVGGASAFDFGYGGGRARATNHPGPVEHHADVLRSDCT